jgi:predicted RNase H-like HicB family nuclease
MKYLVIIEETGIGYSAFSPDLLGCVATGSSKEEVENNMKDAVAFHLEEMDQEGQEIPKPHSFSTYLEIPA